MIGRSIYTLFILVGVLYSTPAHSTNQYAVRLSKLQTLIDNNLSDTQEVTTDSIILWEKELEPMLEKEEAHTLLFQLKQLAVSAYASRGDMSLSTDLARQMYTKAKSMNFPIGIAFANKAIGETYLNAGRKQEAIESYEEALVQFGKSDDTEIYQAQVLPRLIRTLLQANQRNKAAIYLKQLDAVYDKKPSESTYFYRLIAKTYYHIKMGEMSQAEALLAEAESKCKTNKIPEYQYIADYLAATYYNAMGESEKALQLFTQLRAESPSISNRLLLTYKEEATLLIKLGRIDEACRIYQRANTRKDSLNAITYSRQINELRAVYQVDQIEIQSQAQQSRIIYWATIIVLVILLLIVYFVLRTKVENNRLRRSNAKLETAKKFAEDSIRTKSLFLSNMSHEIRTPLNALSGFSSILTDGSIDSETRQQCNEIIQQNSELLLKLINDVIDLSSLDVGKLTFKLKPCDAVSICRNVVDTVKKVKQTQADVSFVTSLSTLNLLTDDSRLQQVLINLLINATKFTTAGTITLELSKESETVARFTVTDTGCGIPITKQGQIFNRFEKLNEGAQGTGLGLSICQLIIEQIGGTISIDPQYTDGARFVFTHPLCPIIKKEKAQ